MAKELYGVPFSTLVERLKAEIGSDSIYSLNRRFWWTGQEGVDLSYEHFGRRIGTPVGPASGPHTQLAQNIVLAWLGGGRFMELKTVQIMDDLKLDKHCIYAPNVGYNIEWSQELRIEDSIREYVKAWYLLHLLTSDRGDGTWKEMDAIFDLSVGYDLEGIKSEKITNYLQTMKHAEQVIEELKTSLPEDLRQWADIDVPPDICKSITISTFHGCPVDEIEEIATHLMVEHGFNTILKLNPTLLGYETVRSLINEQLGYEQVELDPKHFEKDLTWTQLKEMMPKLREVAQKHGVQIGVKFTNTLITKKGEHNFPNTEESYLSGPPLHVIAMTLVDKFVREFGHDYPITFSAGIDASNFADAVASGIGPITVSTDLLKTQGYGRLHKYLKNLSQKMKEVGANDISSFRKAMGGKENPQDAAVSFLSKRVALLPTDPKYHKASNSKLPKKVGSHLKLFDCLSCNKCVPVCPNNANFTFLAPKGSYKVGRLEWKENDWQILDETELQIRRPHQLGTTADICNLCGNCDTWCPEDGGPYKEKPNLYLTRQAFEEHPERDGFLLGPDYRSILWRHDGQIYKYERLDDDDSARFELPDGTVLLLKNDLPSQTQGSGQLDLSIILSMKLVLDGLLVSLSTTWLPSQKLYQWQWTQ